MSESLRVLGIETSCDDTGVAIYDSQKGLLAHSLFSQIETHQEYGGVVPELAARDHIRKVLPLVETVLKQADCTSADIDGIAYTCGPGLAGALLAGSAVAKGLAFGWNVPAVGVHHMEGHLLAPMLEDPAPEFPFVALLVSGGHTLLALVKGIGQYQILGQTVDDAVGEAFDKTAKILGLDYPGGPAIAKAAAQGDPTRFKFPRPMTDRPGLDFSFSGLKTFALTTAKKHAQDHKLDTQTVNDVACAFQIAAVDTLVIKCRRALEQVREQTSDKSNPKNAQRLVVAGGVGANIHLREQLNSQLTAQVFYPRIEFCTDNGAMIAYAGSHRLRQALKDNTLQASLDDLAFQVKPRWSLEELPAI